MTNLIIFLCKVNCSESVTVTSLPHGIHFIGLWDHSVSLTANWELKLNWEYFLLLFDLQISLKELSAHFCTS